MTDRIDKKVDSMGNEEGPKHPGGRVAAGIGNEADLKQGVVDKVVSVFSTVPPRKDTMAFVDDVFAAARVRLEEMAETVKRSYYEDVFERRLERLKALGCPVFILNKLATKKEDVIAEACAMKIPDNRDPLIPVISGQYLTIYSQLQMINIDGMTGDTALESSRITNALKKGLAQNDAKTFDGLYFLLDVDDGEGTEKLTCAEADQRIRMKNRLPLTAEEIIALLVQRTEPFHRNLLAGGSRYEQDDIVPFCTTENEKILLKTCYYGTVHPNSVTISCGARV